MIDAIPFEIQHSRRIVRARNVPSHFGTSSPILLPNSVPVCQSETCQRMDRLGRWRNEAGNCLLCKARRQITRRGGGFRNVIFPFPDDVASWRNGDGTSRGGAPFSRVRTPACATFRLVKFTGMKKKRGAEEWRILKKVSREQSDARLAVSFGPFCSDFSARRTIFYLLITVTGIILASKENKI